jgi:serine/threonine protein kinase
MGCGASASGVLPSSDDERSKFSKDFHDEYLLGEKLGKGSFAQVRIATRLDGDLQDSEIGTLEENAVKITDLRSDKKDEVQRRLKKVADEVTIWVNLGQHANCVRLYDVRYGADLCYMVMERCSCCILNYLEQLPEFNERTLGAMFSQMLQGILHVHANGYVHRDIKGENFLLSGDGTTIKLCDFGLSVVLPQSVAPLSGMYGTAPYMSPEMLNHQGYNEKTDIWSFGVLVYVLVFGSFPYTCREYAAAPMKAAIIKGIPPKFQAVEDRSFFDAMRSSSIVEFSKKLLERDPEERPSAVDAMSSTFMLSVASDTHMCGVKLPSLSSTLQRAKNAFAFEIHDLSRENGVDGLLNELQMRKHGRPLPNATRTQRISEQSFEPKKEGLSGSRPTEG